MPKQRVYALARELGLRSIDLIQRLRALGFSHITSHANSLTSNESRLIKEQFRAVAQSEAATSGHVDAAEGYQWDIFISYQREEPVGNWVRDHFYKRLYEWLSESMTRKPTIFIDDNIGIGADWRDELRQALRTSRFLVSILSPSYFQSAWCMAEWSTMTARSTLLKLSNRTTPQCLIYPIVFANKELLPKIASELQYRDFSQWDINYSAFETTVEYGDFIRAMQEVAKELGALIPQAPPWNPTWPVETPPPEPPPDPPLPRLQ